MYSNSSAKPFSQILYPLTLLLFFLFGGCSAQNGSHPSSLSNVLSQEQTVQAFRKQCPPVRDPEVQQIVQSIGRRLASTRESPRYVRIELLSCSSPFSLAVSSDLVLLSTGMLHRLPSESALAFVLAHELAHIWLKHIEHGNNERPSEYRQDDERDADKQALYTIIAAHYHPWAALETFSQPDLFQHGHSPSATHPLIQERANTLHELLAQADWRPPGTVSSRSYKRMMHFLS